MKPTKFDGYYVCENGKIFRSPNKNFDGKNCSELVEVKQFYRGGGIKTITGGVYKAINISLKDFNGKTLRQIKYYVHRLIAETLIENPLNLPEIDHIDRNKENNHPKNLRWCDRKTNNKNR